MTATINSKNPANTSTLAGAFAETWEKFASNFDDCLPARVVSYERETNTVTVQPLVQRVRTDGTVLSRPEIENIPCVSMGTGSAVLNFPLSAGDLGWIKATDRDISLYLEALSERPPNTLRKHNFADAIFLPDAWANFVIDQSDAGALATLQTQDATQRVVLEADRVKLASNNLVSIEATTTNTTGATNLGNTGGAAGIARLGDTVDVTVLPDEFGAGIPPALTIVSGVITSSSTTNTAS